MQLRNDRDQGFVIMMQMNTILTRYDTKMMKNEPRLMKNRENIFFIFF